MTHFTIRRATAADKPEWLRMRLLLWPYHTPDELLPEMEAMLADAEQPVFLLFRTDGSAGGFLEGGTRKYADGCDTSPVGYIEGWYVDADLRKQGAGGALVQAMEDWARQHGLTEMGSDTWQDNAVSIEAHKRLGYVEMERLVHFAKKL